VQHESDFLVIGSGVAGLTFALKAAAHGSVTLLTKAEMGESNSRYAQGGIAAVWDPGDSHDEHADDTMIAGAGLCRREAVEFVVKNGPDRIQELIQRGVEFTRARDSDADYDLTREGGHGKRRILHAKDMTGQEIIRALVAAVRADPRIELKEEVMAVDLITSGWLARRTQELPPTPDRVLGAYALDLKNGEVVTYASRVVALCTGGAGKVYLYTSNPDIASGDGIAMAWRCGARIANMEFVQFHPTCLYHPHAKGFLISEALRGEGGILRNAGGERFMERYDERLELAPRDIVARAIDAELKSRGEDSMFLDMTHLDPAFLVDHFPGIHARCMSYGIDMREQPIPVVPAAHYFCGGAVTDLKGEASIHNLFVVGEASCTGLHGANRLASNSLLEGVVFAHAAAAAAIGRLDAPIEVLPDWDAGAAINSDEQVVLKHTWDEIRQFMWNYVGIVRTNKRLRRARRRIQMTREEIEDYYWDFRMSGDLVELRNLADVASMVVKCALLRRESRGLHYTLNYPDSDERQIRDTVISRWM